jgi:hypothetical protein
MGNKHFFFILLNPKGFALIVFRLKRKTSDLGLVRLVFAQAKTFQVHLKKPFAPAKGFP